MTICSLFLATLFITTGYDFLAALLIAVNLQFVFTVYSVFPAQKKDKGGLTNRKMYTFLKDIGNKFFYFRY